MFNPAIVFWWIIFSALVGWFWWSKGQNAWLGVITSLVLSPLIAVIIVLIIGDNEEVLKSRAIKLGTHKECPFCKSLIHKDATICPQCRNDLSSTFKETIKSRG